MMKFDSMNDIIVCQEDMTTEDVGPPKSVSNCTLYCMTAGSQPCATR